MSTTWERPVSIGTGRGRQITLESVTTDADPPDDDPAWAPAGHYESYTGLPNYIATT